jgi:hypothetical protein
MDRLKAMRAFVQVVDSGSFSAAARRLNVGQPALSKSIAQLEDRLGAKLVVRTTAAAMPIIFDAPVMTFDRVIMSSSGFSCRLALLDDSFTLALHRFHEVGRGCSFE